MCSSSRGRRELITQWCLNCRTWPVCLFLGQSESTDCSGSLLGIMLVTGESNAKCRLKPGLREKRSRHLWTNSGESVKLWSFYLKQLKGCLPSQVSVLELCSLCFNFPEGKLRAVARLCTLGVICVCVCRWGHRSCWRQLQGHLRERWLLSTDLNSAKVWAGICTANSAQTQPGWSVMQQKWGIAARAQAGGSELLPQLDLALGVSGCFIMVPAWHRLLLGSQPQWDMDVCCWDRGFALHSGQICVLNNFTGGLL